MSVLVVICVACKLAYNCMQLYCDVCVLSYVFIPNLWIELCLGVLRLDRVSSIKFDDWLSIDDIVLTCKCASCLMYEYSCLWSYLYCKWMQYLNDLLILLFSCISKTEYLCRLFMPAIAYYNLFTCNVRWWLFRDLWSVILHFVICVIWIKYDWCLL
jgi:hypothetical protein